MISEDSTLMKTIFAALAVCLGYTPGDSAASALIHQAYLEPESPARPPRERDEVYYSLRTEDDPEDRVQSGVLSNPASGDGKVMTVRSFLSYQLVIVCYGPHAEAYAHRIRSFLYLDGYGKPRAILRAAGIYPIPDPPQPNLMEELEGSLWRRRADLTVSIRVRDEMEARVPVARYVAAPVIWS